VPAPEPVCPHGEKLISVLHTRERPAAIRVAIVDDHRLVLDGLTSHLNSRRHGIRVTISESSWAGLLANSEFPVDVVVLDLNLHDDISIGAKVRALSAAGCRTIVISRHAESSSIQGAIRAGALGFVPKTESGGELVRAIQSAAAGQQYENAPLAGALSNNGRAADPGLGRQELRAIMLYASGRSIREVAGDMGTTVETVKSYIKRGRRKYREIGIDLGTKILLRRHGIREGWITPE
jgi:two-component system uhpT operon response regulator UhpA